MGKSKHPRDHQKWGDPFQFTGDEDQATLPEVYATGWEDGEMPETLVEEAHDALSRLYSKTNKRAKAAKIPRKIHSWQ